MDGVSNYATGVGMDKHILLEKVPMPPKNLTSEDLIKRMGKGGHPEVVVSGPLKKRTTTR